MEVRVLRYFLAIVQEKTITGAARRLHISQPTLSRQLTELETALGTPLFKRGAREVTLTAKGRYLVTRARAIVDLVDKTTQNLTADQTIIGGSLDIGAGESRGLQRLMDVAAQLQQDYPAVQIHLHSGDAALVEGQLTDGRLDFGVIMGSRQLGHYQSLKLPEQNRWGVLLPKAASLAQQATIRPDELVGHPLLISERAQKRETFQDWWCNVADRLTFAGTYNLVFNASLLVRSGSCYALAFADLVDISPASGLTFRPLEPAIHDTITLIWSQTQPLSPVAQLFLNRLRANLTNG